MNMINPAMYETFKCTDRTELTVITTKKREWQVINLILTGKIPVAGL